MSAEHVWQRQINKQQLAGSLSIISSQMARVTVFQATHLLVYGCASMNCFSSAFSTATKKMEQTVVYESSCLCQGPFISPYASVPSQTCIIVVGVVALSS